jgi:hypothetical protein
MEIILTENNVLDIYKGLIGNSKGLSKKEEEQVMKRFWELVNYGNKKK